MGVSAALGSSALLPAGLGFRNKIINGNMAISQRGTSAISNLAAANTYGTDRWHLYGQSASKMTITQSVTNPTGQGFSNSTLVTSSAATTPGSGDYYGLRQYIEGSNMVDLAWGTSGAKPVVVSFWVRSSIVGTYSFALFNSVNNRVLISTYTISVVDTWEKKTIYINAGDTTGTWETGNGIGTSVWFDLGSGTANNGTAGVWTAGLPTRTSGSVNWIGTNGATFYITGVQLEQNYQPTPFEQRPIGTELALCQRYYYRLGNTSVSGAYLVPSNNIVYSASAVEGCLQHPVPMRISSVTFGSNSVYAYNAYQGNWVGIPRAAVSSSNSTTHAAIITDRSGGTSWATFVTGTTQMAFALVANTSAGYIEVSAEL